MATQACDERRVALAGGAEFDSAGIGADVADSDRQEIQIFRTVMRTSVPILSNFKRTVWHCAWASSVPAKPSRRSACISW